MEYNHDAIHEDEIDLRELARTIGRHKKKLIIFSLIVTVLSVAWTLSKPNIYQSQAVLVPQEQSKASSLGGLGALAGMAGIDIGGGEMTPDQAFGLYLTDYNWMREFMDKSGLFLHLNDPLSDHKYRFAFGYRGIYDALHSNSKPIESLSDAEREKLLYATYQSLSSNLSVTSDKKTMAITITYSHSDPILAQKVVDTFLSYASESLRKEELNSMEKKLAYYNDELEKTNDLALKTQLSQLMSALIQKKVLAQSGDYYNVKLVLAPHVAYTEDKEGPKRGLIIVVTMITSLILGIFGIFFIEFIRSKNEDS